MGGIFGNRQIRAMKNEESSDFHALGLRVITTNVTIIREKTREGFQISLYQVYSKYRGCY